MGLMAKEQLLTKHKPPDLWFSSAVESKGLVSQTSPESEFFSRTILLLMKSKNICFPL